MTETRNRQMIKVTGQREIKEKYKRNKRRNK